MIATILAEPMTGTALSISLRAPAGIGLIEDMPVHALIAHGPCAATDINQVSDRLQMLRVDAAPVAAEMIDFESCRNGADEPFVSESVGIESAPTHSHLSVSGSVRGAHPLPTRMEGDQFNLGPEARLSHGILHGWQSIILWGALRVTA